MARLPSKNRCAADRPLGKHTDHPLMLPPGECAACGIGPLHGAWRSVWDQEKQRWIIGGNRCRCSAERAGVLLCRECAIAFDITTKGHSRLENRYSPELLADMYELFQRGIKAISATVE